MHKRFTAVVLLICLLPCAAQPAKKKHAKTPSASAKAAALAASMLAASIDKLLDDGPSAQAHWGVLVVDLKDNRVVFARNEHRLFAPASNTKLFTTATALETLGPAHKFHTTVEAAAPPDAQGQITGDLVLVGRGDPNLSPRVLPYAVRSETQGPAAIALDKLADQLAASGIRSITGDIIGDDTYFLFERYGDGWTIDDTLWSYGAPVSALTINDNNVWLTVSPGEKPSDWASVKLEPFEKYFEIENRIRTVSAGGERRVHVSREPGSRRLEIWGQVPVGDAVYHETLASDDPADLAARYLRDALIAHGVAVSGQGRARHRRAIDRIGIDHSSDGTSHDSPFVLATVESLPLVEDLRLIDKVSQNLHAEMLLRTVGHAAGEAGSVSAGLTVEKDFLKKAGVDAKEFVLFDGSGLSRGNLVAPAATVSLLTYMDHSPNRAIWHDALPLAGADGSLLSRLHDSCTISKVEAKTGTLRHVAALSGYLTASHGHRLAFSLMVNNHNMPTHDATTVMDRVLEEICKVE
jgi:D-alanyl-D-alanine carboxypeptidase/D-alanyl-D-alanine-endopeptidase (penicillin-binding protein 4)